MKEYLPLAARQALARLRHLQHPADVFGRYAVGGLQAHVAPSVHAPRWRQIRIGRGAQIERGTLLHTNDLGKACRIVIGAGAFIGQSCFFSAGDLIEIGPHCLIGAACNLLGAGHAVDDPTRRYAASPVISYGRIVLEANCWIGTASTVVGEVRIGFGSIVAAASLLRQSVPPLCLVAGHPARIRRIFDWDLRKWRAVPVEDEEFREAMRRHERSLPTQARFLEHVRACGTPASPGPAVDRGFAQR